MDRATLVERIVGLGRGAFGTGGGGAASCGEAGSGETDSAAGGSLKREGRCLESGMAEMADIMAWRWDVHARLVVEASEDNMDDQARLALGIT